MIEYPKYNCEAPEILNDGTAQSLIEFLEKKIKPFRTIEKLSSFVGDLLFERQSKVVLTKHRNIVTLK